MPHMKRAVRMVAGFTNMPPSNAIYNNGHTKFTFYNFAEELASMIS